MPDAIVGWGLESLERRCFLAATIVGTLPGQLGHFEVAAQVMRGGFRFDQGQRRYLQQVTITNTTNQPIGAPLSLELTGMAGIAWVPEPGGSDPDPPLTNASDVVVIDDDPFTGLFNNVQVYVNLDVPTDDGLLAPGEAVATTLQFTNPNHARINYTTRVLSGQAEPTDQLRYTLDGVPVTLDSVHNVLRVGNVRSLDFHTLEIINPNPPGTPPIALSGTIELASSGTRYSAVGDNFVLATIQGAVKTADGSLIIPANSNGGSAGLSDPVTGQLSFGDFFPVALLEPSVRADPIFDPGEAIPFKQLEGGESVAFTFSSGNEGSLGGTGQPSGGGVSFNLSGNLGNTAGPAPRQEIKVSLIPGKNLTPPVAENAVPTNDANIANGATGVRFATTRPSTIVNRTFRVSNIGNAPLRISNITISGAGFSLLNLPAFPKTVAAAIQSAPKSTTFVVRMNISTPGTHVATITVLSNSAANPGDGDGDDSKFKFKITGIISTTATPSPSSTGPGAITVSGGEVLALQRKPAVLVDPVDEDERLRRVLRPLVRPAVKFSQRPVVKRRI